MIFITSTPKTGTHLLAQTLEMLTGHYSVSVKKNNLANTDDYLRFQEYPNLVGHFRLSHVTKNMALRQLMYIRKVFILIRDPRDVCNSMLHYLEQSANPDHIAATKQLLGLSYQDKTKAAASGITIPGLKFTVASHCSGFIELADTLPHACLLRYAHFFSDDSLPETIANFLECETHLVKECLNKALNADTVLKESAFPTLGKKISMSIYRFF